MTGLLGGAFDPPHNGHLALAEAAIPHFRLERLLVLVVAEPGHKAVEVPFEDRYELASLAFRDVPRTEVVRERHAYTVDAVRDGSFGDAIFLVGADEFADFLSWKDPNGVLEHVRLGVATRPGHGRERLDGVLDALERPGRVVFFEIPAVPVASSEIRAHVARGEPIGDLVPPAVEALIADRGLYR
ncbi:MAG: nicotinate-nicotinamide nucleotide adenylyltransferase [Gaiellaceae bacterium]